MYMKISLFLNICYFMLIPKKYFYEYFESSNLDINKNIISNIFNFTHNVFMNMMSKKF